MSEIKYHDFDLKIEPRQADGRYRVVVQNSPLGQATGYMRLPKTIAELRDMVDEAEQEVRGVKKVERSPHVAVQGPTEELGDLLFRGLFSDNVRDTYVGSLGRVQGKPDVGLRVKIHVDLYDSSLAELASLPWELLYKRETQDFLNLSLQTPIVRYLDVSQPAAPLALQLPLRVLVCMASPTDCAKLELEQERALIERNLGGRKDIDLHFLAHPTPEQLQDKLSTAPFHILHYMGHGGFSAQTGQGMLLLENDVGQSRSLSAEDLAMLLADNPTVRLVFLNACETARTATRAGQDPFSGVATALVMKGMLAVIAMQFPITDGAAIAFTKRIYPLLARGYPIDAAVAEGRKAVRLAEPGSLEWATPVLFLRAPNGKLFDVPTAAQQAVAEVQQTEHPRPQGPVNLGKLYWQGRTHIKNEHWRAALDCFQRVTAEQPNFTADLPDWLAQAAERVQHEEQLSNLYATARELANEGDWETVVTIFTEIRDLEPQYPDREGLLAQAYYEQALQFMNARKWTAAVERLEQVPDHAEARDLLEIAREEQAAAQRRQQADAIYAEAGKLLREEQWQAALDKLAEARGVIPDYADAEKIAEIAHEKLAAEGRRREADALYAEAVKLRDAQNWQGARDKLAAVREVVPAYPDAERVEETANAELAKIAEAEREAAARQRQADALYGEAVKLLKGQKWQAALDKWAEVRGVVADYADKQNVAATAQQKLQEIARAEKKRREEAERRERLANLPERIKGQDGKEMILIPAGAFTMGSADDDPDAQDREKPQHTVHLDAYYIDRYPVTNAEYKKFVDATGHRKPKHWVKKEGGFLGIGGQEVDAYPHDKDDHPVVYIDWEDAVAYAKWAGQRLPTEAEWEKAARGTDGRRYPWGDEWDKDQCNTEESGIGGTTPVGKYSPAGDSPYGVADLAGNVWEWCADWYDENYYRGAEASTPNPQGPGSGAYRVARGGSYYSNKGRARCACRAWGSLLAGRYNYDGFRCGGAAGSLMS